MEIKEKRYCYASEINHYFVHLGIIHNYHHSTKLLWKNSVLVLANFRLILMFLFKHDPIKRCVHREWYTYLIALAEEVQDECCNGSDDTDEEIHGDQHDVCSTWHVEQVRERVHQGSHRPTKGIEVFVWRTKIQRSFKPSTLKCYLMLSNFYFYLYQLNLEHKFYTVNLLVQVKLTITKVLFLCGLTSHNEWKSWAEFPIIMHSSQLFVVWNAVNNISRQFLDKPKKPLQTEGETDYC